MAKKSNNNNAIAKITPDIDVPGALEKISKEIENMQMIQDTPYRTTGTLEVIGTTINVKTETSVENLIKAMGSVLERERVYNNAQNHLGIKTVPVFSVNGGNSEDWTHDIKLRINIIQQKAKLDKLNEYKDKMSKFLSEEDQKRMLVEDIQKFAKSL